MYYNLGTAMKQRLILELRDSFSFHPEYKKIVPFIQNKFAFPSRPQFGIVIKGASVNKVQLAPDNYVGPVVSHVMLAYVGQPQYPIEWVREDTARINANGLETLPGVYYIEILSAPTPTEPGYYAIDPLLTVEDEAVLRFQSGIERVVKLQHVPLQKTLRLYINRRFPLIEGADYTVNYTTGEVTLIGQYSPNERLTADYRYAGTSTGPHAFWWNTADFKTLPGVVMAFGKRAEKDQKVAVVVYSSRVTAAEAYGGKFESNFDIDVIARDPIQSGEIADLTFMYLWAEKKARLELEGIEVLDVSQGGESEEMIGETEEMFSYMTSLSIQLRADWEVHVPLPLTIARVTPTTAEGDFSPSARSGLQKIRSEAFYNGFPVLIGRNNNFERIA